MNPGEIKKLIVKAQQDIQLILKTLENDTGVFVTGVSINKVDVTKVGDERRSYIRNVELNIDEPTTEKWS